MMLPEWCFTIYIKHNSWEPYDPALTWAWTPVGEAHTTLAENPSLFSQSPVSTGSSLSSQTVQA